MRDLLIIVAALVISGGCGVVFFRVPRATLPRIDRSGLTAGPLTCTGVALWLVSLFLMSICNHEIGKFGRVGLLGCAVVGYLLCVVGGVRDKKLRDWTGWLVAGLGGVLMIVVLCAIIVQK